MRRLLLSSSFVISVIAAFATPYILESFIPNANLLSNLPLAAGVLFVLFWGATLIVGVKFIATVEADSYGDMDESDQEAGTVKWFNTTKGFGFITRDSGEDVFVHFRSIRGDGHRSLQEGQRVHFYVSASDKGMQAEDVCIIE